MAKNAGQKLKLLYIVKILSEETDENHCISTKDLINRLESYGVAAERKSIYDDIAKLQDFGYDIIQNNNRTGAGYYLASREFELAELKLLVDAVQSSRFITQKKSNELIHKLEYLASKHEAKQLQRQVYVAGRVKTENESIYYHIDEKLIDYALQTTDAFMFVCCNYYNSKKYSKKAAAMRKQLAPLSIKRRSEPKWPGTVMYSTKYKYLICFYRSHPDAAEVLKEPGRSFGWVYPDFPEDLAFFRNGKCWMTTVAHEEMLWFTNETHEDIAFLESIGLMETAGHFPDTNEPFVEEGL